MMLSILVPSRNEMFLKNTVEDILKNKRGETEIIVGLDGAWSEPPIAQHPDVNVIYVSQSIGQRAMANLCAKLSRAKYVCKVDAHISISEGWDVEMINAMEKVGDNVTMVSTMRNLWCFSWKCYKCGWKKYQGPTPEKCPNCGRSHRLHRKMVWIGKERPQSNSYCFDSEPHFQYFNEYTKRPEYKEAREKTGLTETMSLQGSCFMATREKYWELNLCGEDLGSWGNQGLEVACRTWLSGGRVLVNHKCWYSHLFRTQGGDFGFPYEQHGKEVDKTKKRVWEFFFSGWDKQIHPVSWLVEKFWPCKGWSEDDLKKLKERDNKNKV